MNTTILLLGNNDACDRESYWTSELKRVSKQAIETNFICFVSSIIYQLSNIIEK